MPWVLAESVCVLWGTTPRKGFMMNRTKLSARSRFLAVVAGVAALSAPAMAQAPTMPAIAFEIDLPSVGVAIGAAGATVLLLVFGYKVGFSLIHRLVRRLTKAI